MPITILLVLVVGGITGIAVLLHLMGKSSPRLMDPEDARAAWHRHVPDDVIHQVILAENGQAALILTDQGPGLVWSFGIDTVARHLLDFDLIEDGNRLRVVFHDFTAPQAILHLTDTERQRWQSLMDPT